MTKEDALAATAGEEAAGSLAMIEQLDRIASATTPEEVFDDGARSADDVLEQTLALHEIEDRDGDYGAYVLLHVGSLDGDRFTVSCGGELLVAQAKRLQELGALPVAIRIVRKDTKNGRRVYKLARPV